VGHVVVLFGQSVNQCFVGSGNQCTAFEVAARRFGSQLKPATAKFTSQHRLFWSGCRCQKIKWATKILENIQDLGKRASKYYSIFYI